MFERQKFGLDYWTKQATLKPILAPASTGVVEAIVRGEAEVGVASPPDSLFAYS